MIYPNIDNCDFNRDDDSNKYNTSCLEKNCNQIFVKGQNITEGIYEMVKSDIVPKKTSLCGRRMRIGRIICKYTCNFSIMSSLNNYSFDTVNSCRKLIEKIFKIEIFYRRMFNINNIKFCF